MLLLKHDSVCLSDPNPTTLTENVCEFGLFPEQKNQLNALVDSLKTRTALFVTKKSVYLEASFSSAKVFPPAALT